MGIRIVDTTLRDGEQKAGVALKTNEKLKIAQLLDKIGVYQIEAGTPVMCGEEKECIKEIASLGLKCKISSWNRMNIEDLYHSLDCGVDIIHISVPSSDIQINFKLKKSRDWVLDRLRECLDFMLDKNCEVTIGLEDASRAEIAFIMEIIELACSQSIRRVRYADTVGILCRRKVFEQIKEIRSNYDVDLGIHAHNDLGMAVSNSIAAVIAGAKYVDCTIGGIGERAGNCDFIKFIKAGKACLNVFDNYKINDLTYYLYEIGKIIGGCSANILQI